MQPLRVSPAAGDTKIHFAGKHLALDAARVVIAQVQPHRRIEARELRGCRCHQLGNGRRCCRDAHLAKRLTTIAQHVFEHPVKVGQQPHHPGQQIAPHRREPDLAAAALEQPGAQRRLQLVHQRGDGGLGLEQASRRLGKAALLRHHGKGMEMLEGDVLGQPIHFKMR
ncbi:hypothetical protein D3C72_1475210 [compost metagenome]